LKKNKLSKLNNLKSTKRDPLFREVQEIAVKIYLYPLMVQICGRSFID